MNPEKTIAPDVVMRNEFSLVELRYEHRGDSVSLAVTDSLTGNQIALDATELEALARAPHEAFRALLRDLDAQHASHEDAT